MSARSFAHSSLVAVVALAACGSKKPEADPAKVQAAAKLMSNASVPFAGLRACAAADFQLPSMSQLTLVRLAQEEVADIPGRLPWVNPPELDAPFARVLLESTDDTARRQAAAEFLTHKAFMVFRVDLVDIPLALGFKELKRGAAGVRAIAYDRATGDPICVKQFTVQNDRDKSEWAMKTTNKAVVDPAVSQALQADFGVQFLAKRDQLRTGP